jgi:hypothetical protein
MRSSDPGSYQQSAAAAGTPSGHRCRDARRSSTQEEARGEGATRTSSAHAPDEQRLRTRLHRSWQDHNERMFVSTGTSWRVLVVVLLDVARPGCTQSACRALAVVPLLLRSSILGKGPPTCTVTVTGQASMRRSRSRGFIHLPPCGWQRRASASAIWPRTDQRAGSAVHLAPGTRLRRSRLTG